MASMHAGIHALYAAGYVCRDYPSAASLAQLMNNEAICTAHPILAITYDGDIGMYQRSYGRLYELTLCNSLPQMLAYLKRL